MASHRVTQADLDSGADKAECPLGCGVEFMLGHKVVPVEVIHACGEHQDEVVFAMAHTLCVSAVLEGFDPSVTV